MATTLAPWERERFNYGEAANDKKGDPIRVHAIKAEHADTLLFTWLSGGLSETRLPDSLPISRGGTGATTVAGTLRNLGYFEDTNHTLRRGVKVITLANTGVIDRFNNLADVTFTHSGVGEYILRGIVLDTTLFGLVFPTNNLNQLEYLATTELNANNEVVVKVFTVVYTAGIPVAGVQVDLPTKVYIDIECK